MSTFEQMLTGGKPNSLGRTYEIIAQVLRKPAKLEELFACLFSEDEYVRFRAGDGLEKICRIHPDWFRPYVERLLSEVAEINQPSVRWHLAEMLGEITLTPRQKSRAIAWLKTRLSEASVDWIVARRCMETLVKFIRSGDITKETLLPLLQKQTQHHSKSTARVAGKLLEEISN